MANSNQPEIVTSGGIIMPNPDYKEPERFPATDLEVAVAKALVYTCGGVTLPVFAERDNPHVERGLKFQDHLRKLGYMIVGVDDV
jgi:hypothetical protein